MARLIDADEFMKEIRKWLGNETDFRSLQEVIAGMPTIEAEPVKHGKWVIAKDKDGFAMWDACSSCGHGLHYVCEGKRFPYCPNCGARMDGE